MLLKNKKILFFKSKSKKEFLFCLLDSTHLKNFALTITIIHLFDRKSDTNTQHSTKNYLLKI